MTKDNTVRTSVGITRSELTDMLEKYAIGKKPLSKLLGWGETTVLLYLRGEDELPDNEYTRRLKYLYSNTEAYLRLLNEEGGRISEVARRRSMEAVRGLIPRSAISDAAKYILKLHRNRPDGTEGETVSLLRLETILFWSQVVSLCLYGEPVFEDDYLPGKSGMPFKSIEEKFCDIRVLLEAEEYEDKAVQFGELSERKMLILGFVHDMFEWFGYQALAELMEAERFRLCGPKGARKRRSASKEMLRKCYGEVFTQAKVKKLRDVEAYMHKRMRFIRK